MPEKLIYITEQNLRDAEKNRNATVDTNWLNDLNDLYNKTRHPNVKQIGDLPPGVGPDDSIFEPKEWFSNTTYYEYMDSFLIGLDLEGIDLFKNANKCIFSIIGFVDDTTQFDNNITKEFEFTDPDEIIAAYPYLNFTGMVAGPFAEVLPYCYEFLAIEALAYWNNLYAQMNNDFSILIQAFLFTQMGNALKYRTAIDHIDDNN